MRSSRDLWVLKICSAGSYQVGKTSLIHRYAEGKFIHDYLPTIGVDITTKKITVDDHQVKIVLVDTAGEEYFGKIRKTYFEGAFGCIIVYDITREETFTELDRWISDFRSVVGDDAAISIIGNKIDLEDLRCVTPEQGQKIAKQYGVPFYECSAKLGGEIIPQIYEDLVRRYFLSLQEKSSE
ncbi:MAG: Rab family GTPase [Candidatus Hodarchaeota archaeon]